MIELPRSIDDLPTSMPRWVGQPIPRVEDRSLLTGQTAFIDNLNFPGMLHCAFVRSPHAHARIKSVDISDAGKLDGVVAIVTGEDARRETKPIHTAPPGWGSYCLAADKVRFFGEPVAAVAATSRYIAEDAAELIQVEYEPLPAVVDAPTALGPDSPLVFDEKGTNVMFQRRFVWGDVDGAFADADHVVTERYRWHRVGANPMETFGVISQWDPIEGTLTCHGSFQVQGFSAVGAAATFGIPLNRVRFIAQPHGGSFGGKGGQRGTIVTAMLSRRSGGRPVKWIEDRIEYLSAGGSQAWDRHYEASLALKRDGTMTGLRVRLIDDLGATAEGYGAIGAAKPLACFTGCYGIGAAEYDLTIVATNKLPASAYRGMGPPPHTMVVEQLIDIAARELGQDPAELRRKNFIPPERFPYTIPSGNVYDSGNYAATLEKALELADYSRLLEEREEARRDGRLFGIGVVSTIEPGVFSSNVYSVVGFNAGTAQPEGITLGIDLFGTITARLGFAHEGQGQYTVVTQLVADYFGVDPANVRVVVQDSASAPPGYGPGGSRLGVAISAATLGAAERLKEKLVRVAAKLMEANPAEVELMDGKLRIRGTVGTEMPIGAVAATMLTRSDLLPPDMEPSPEATYVWTAPDRNMPDEQGRARSYLTAANACHVVAVEIDRETGQVQILKYCIADDCGTRLNPAIVAGMTQGGLAQGVAAALLEEYVYDDGGQLVTSTFMDYLLPTIYEVPVPLKAELVTPSPFTALGAKGMGEGAIHTAPAAIVSAINDALVPLNIRARETPVTPDRLWRLLQAATP
jgi:CO/xanthine dehydrogenase Mo-binding subunit